MTINQSKLGSNVTIVVGANWGDEGKGRMVDYFAQNADVVVRYQGGNNAGHTVMNELGTFKLHSLPSGVLNKNCVNVLGPGMVINLEALNKELLELYERGIRPTIAISERATLVLPFHLLEDRLEENRLGDDAFGSTLNGIAYAYADRAAKKAIQLGALKHPKFLKKELHKYLEWKRKIILGLYGVELKDDLESLFDLVMEQAKPLLPLICNTHSLLKQVMTRQQNIILEAQLGSLRDITHGIYPFTTSSHVLADYAPIGSGLPGMRDRNVIAVTKAFSTSVGSGPFVCTMEDADEFRIEADEFGATTGRARDIGHFDAVATRYGIELQDANEIVLTKLDCLTGLMELQICHSYQYKNEQLTDFPINPILEQCTPVYETVPGWQDHIDHIRDFAELPAAAKKYIERIEELLGKKIRYISVGPVRDQLIVRPV